MFYINCAPNGSRNMRHLYNYNDIFPGNSAVYLMVNDFLRMPEFTNHYRNLSSHANKTMEDAASFQLMRSMVGLQSLSTNGGGCHFSLPSTSQVQQKLGLTVQERKIVARLLLTASEVVDIGEFRVDRGLSLVSKYEDALLPGEVRPLATSEGCLNCKCQNMEVIPADQSIKWRFDTWVTIMTTLGSIGVVASFCLGLFLVCQICSEVLDASQGYSLLLLLSIMLTYACLVPYAMSPTDLVCPLRSMCMRLAFVLLFAIMLSRSFMMATADVDGLPGHISGPIQAVLLVFMVGVEVRLNV